MITYIIYKIIKRRKERKNQLLYEYWCELIRGE